MTALAWYINKNYIATTSSGTSVKVTTNHLITPTSSNSSAQPSSALLYVTIGSATQIFKNENGSDKKVFTDADETNKIIMFSNLAPEANEVLAITSADSKKVGQLISIDLATAKEKKISDNFSVPENLAIAPDASKLTFTSFSNVEANYGFTLYYENLNDNLPKTAVSSQVEIISPAFSPDASKIAYAITTGTNTVLNTFNITSGKADKVTIFNGDALDWISWPTSDSIIISKRKASNNSAGEIDTVNPNTGSVTEIAEFNGGRAGFVELDSQNKLAFIVAQYNTKVNSLTAGQIYIIDLNSKQKSTLEKASQILGWLN